MLSGRDVLFLARYDPSHHGNASPLPTVQPDGAVPTQLSPHSSDLLTYLGLLQLEHRPSTIPLQHTRFWAASHAPFQLSFWALSSASVSRLQLLQGRPLLRFPWGFQLRACRVMLAGGFLSVWPIQPHFLWRICLASGSCPARSHKSVLLILSGHRMPRIRRRQVLTKHWIFWCNALVVRHVSHPYSNTDLTLELKDS